MNEKKDCPELKFAAALAAALLFALVNFILAKAFVPCQITIEKAVSARCSKKEAKTLTWWVAREFLAQKSAPDIVLFGSSQMGSALFTAEAQFLFKVIDAVTYRQSAFLSRQFYERLGRPVSIFNLAEPGAMASDAYMSSQALFKKGLSPKVVIIGISPRDFMDNTLPCPGATEPYKFYSRFVDPGKLGALAFCDFFSSLQQGCQQLPLRKLGSEMALINPCLPEPPSAAAKKGNVVNVITLNGETGPGQWRVPANMPAIWMDNTREYKNRYRNPFPPAYKSELSFFQEFLGNMKAAGIKVLVVGMPSLPMNRSLLPDKFWSCFRKDINDTCQGNQALWVDLTDSALFDRQDYLDTVHLNARGGAKLFGLIAKFATADRRLSACLQTEGRAGRRSAIAGSPGQMR